MFISNWLIEYYDFFFLFGEVKLLILYGFRNEIKRDGAGRGNWGTPTDEIAQCVLCLF